MSCFRQGGRGQPYIKFPHFALGIRPEHPVAAITIPNGVAGGFRTRLKELGLDRFLGLAQEIKNNLTPVLTRSKNSKAIIYASQRHYRSQPITDGRVEADMRTCYSPGESDVKYQPEWIEALYQVMVNKKSNIQFGIEVQFDYKCPVVQSPGAVDLFADSWKAAKPLLDFILAER
ncbi:MAG: hypothetical protein ABGZ35_04925 [Planctomycetaceae bacterium]